MSSVGRLMDELGIQGACGRAKTITTRPDRHAKKSDDLVKRNFSVDATDKLWVSDLTYIGNLGRLALSGHRYGCVFEEDSWLQDGRHDGHPSVH